MDVFVGVFGDVVAVAEITGDPGGVFVGVVAVVVVVVVVAVVVIVIVGDFSDSAKRIRRGVEAVALM